MMWKASNLCKTLANEIFSCLGDAPPISFILKDHLHPRPYTSSPLEEADHDMLHVYLCRVPSRFHVLVRHDVHEPIFNEQTLVWVTPIFQADFSADLYLRDVFGRKELKIALSFGTSAPYIGIGDWVDV